jgi:transposase-like protein
MRRQLAPEDKAHLVLNIIKSKQVAASLCRKYRISQSCYYAWRKIFILAGTDALRRSSKRSSRPSIREREKYEVETRKNAEKMRLKQSVEALRPNSINRRARLTDAAKHAIVDLIETASIPKLSALADVGIARGTYYRWRKRKLINPQERGSGSTTYVRLADREYVKDAVFKLLHAPPLDHGFNRTTWKIDDLQKSLLKTGLTLGKHAIRTIIRMQDIDGSRLGKS